MLSARNEHIHLWPIKPVLPNTRCRGFHCATDAVFRHSKFAFASESKIASNSLADRFFFHINLNLFLPKWPRIFGLTKIYRKPFAFSTQMSNQCDKNRSVESEIAARWVHTAQWISTLEQISLYYMISIWFHDLYVDSYARWCSWHASQVHALIKPSKALSSSALCSASSVILRKSPVCKSLGGTWTSGCQRHRVLIWFQRNPRFDRQNVHFQQQLVRLIFNSNQSSRKATRINHPSAASFFIRAKKIAIGSSALEKKTILTLNCGGLAAVTLDGAVCNCLARVYRMERAVNH